METRFAIQWKVRGEEDIPTNWLYFISYVEIEKALERFEKLVLVNGKHFDYQIIETPGGKVVHR